MEGFCNKSVTLQLMASIQQGQSTNACVESSIQAVMLLAKQSILNTSKAVKCNDFFFT